MRTSIYDVSIVGDFSVCVVPSFQSVCSLSCLNSGSLNSTSCSCDCVPPYTGPTCESELQADIFIFNKFAAVCTVWTCTGVVYMLLFTAACVLGCQNGGTLNVDTCTCDCVGGFSERNCSG